MNSLTTNLYIALNLESSGEPPRAIRLLPPGGVVAGRDGRRWINDDPAAIAAAFAANGADIPIDWEHATHLLAPRGKRAPAAGWISGVSVGDDGAVVGSVSWTGSGAASVTSREYRYISPVFRFDPESLRILAIVSCGLTNRPNLYLDALNSQGEGDEPLELKRLLAALQLPETGTFETALNRIAEIGAETQTALNAAKNPPLTSFVPRADYDVALNRASSAELKIAEIEQAALETAVNHEIDAALKAGKITPATREYYLAQCRQKGGLDRFREFVRVAPEIGGQSNLDGKKPETGSVALNAQELKVVEMMGLDLAAHKKINNLEGGK